MAWSSGLPRLTAHAPQTPPAVRGADAEEVRGELTRLGFEESRTTLLGEGTLFADDPDTYLKELAREADVTADLAQSTARTWLLSPGYLLIVQGTKSGSSKTP